MDIQQLVRPYSPWIAEETWEAWQRLNGLIPEFRRPVFDRLVEDLESVKQIISVTGPRRVGKSTLLKQLVQHLLNVRHVEPSRVVYYSFDDPALFRTSLTAEDTVEALMEHLCRTGQDAPAYLLLDEIQFLERWEQYLKKYYDLEYPVKMVISGSASSPIFKKSRESLLGRVKDHHVLPFSFREYLLYQLREEHACLEEMARFATAGERLRGMFAKGPAHIDAKSAPVPDMSDELWGRAQEALRVFLVDGGFPEVWEFQTAEQKIEYLFDNQVNKVISEDLVLAVEFRKPEQLKTFYISLLEQPGREVNLTSLSKEIGVNVQLIYKYLPLLEMTDLIAPVGKFRKSPIRVRRGNQKYYLVDLALRNAVLRIGEELLEDPVMLGFYAENLVFNALRKWKGVLQIDYYRSGKNEVDFIVHTRPSRYMPIEVKYRDGFSKKTLSGIEFFSRRHACHSPLVVTKRKQDFGTKEDSFYLPLLYFLLLFD